MVSPWSRRLGNTIINMTTSESGVERRIETLHRVTKGTGLVRPQAVPGLLQCHANVTSSMLCNHLAHPIGRPAGISGINLTPRSQAVSGRDLKDSEDVGISVYETRNGTRVVLCTQMKLAQARWQVSSFTANGRRAPVGRGRLCPAVVLAKVRLHTHTGKTPCVCVCEAVGRSSTIGTERAAG
ncbi:hypothetical protein P280DRAFT_149065 [Massarina eburnea CBS 473.64]|uniref:Uncharacterized protein n=1 Tax=Massarina eburnea CBS 473.64 TaxID=1395130 RepID=A0A6A6RNH9_9PLEO|nr:hypothetical protein P280DRAFT_149065 [Massarina eburnea CBS 473.64]